MVKVLYWATDGFAIWYKRLERGRFTLPSINAADGRIDRRQLAMLLEGVVPKKVSKRYIYQ
jgi:transposase